MSLTINTNINSLNAQVPKYDLVVAANDAYTQGLARRASVLNSAVDWPLALNSLIAITPPQASVETFNGSQAGAVPGSTPAAGSTTGAAAGTQSAGTPSRATQALSEPPALPECASIWASSGSGR